jgi:hypothetical protein
MVEVVGKHRSQYATRDRSHPPRPTPEIVAGPVTYTQQQRIR